MAKKIQSKGAFEWLVDSYNQGMQPDEFTAEMVIQKIINSGQTATRSSVRHKLARMVDEGLVTCRKATIGGKLTNVFAEVKK